MTSKNKTYVKKEIQKEEGKKINQEPASSKLTVEEQLELFAALIVDHLLTNGNEQDNNENKY